MGVYELKNRLVHKPNAILSVDSSTQVASMALSLSGQIIFYEECVRQKSHSEWINGALERAILSWKDGNINKIDLFAVTHGPGSFTGLRVACNFVKSLAYALNKPILSFSTLEILAYQGCEAYSKNTETNIYENSLIENESSKFILPMINAFKNKLYMSLFRLNRGSLERILPDQSIEIDQLEDFLRANNLVQSNIFIQIIGDGYDVFQHIIKNNTEPWYKRSSNICDYPLASTVSKIINNDWSQLSVLNWRELGPTYIRPSSAEEQRTSNHFKSGV